LRAERPGPAEAWSLALVRMWQCHPAQVARRLASLLCRCREQIAEVDRRALKKHHERLDELVACRTREPDALRQRERAAVQKPVAQDADQIVREAAERLERLLAEVSEAWSQRITGCTALEQLRAEVGAIENGAAHRLSLVCDELREAMTVQFVRLVLELSRPLRQELLRKRLDVARGRSAALQETFESVRVVFPGSIDKTFAALRTPELGELRSPPGLLDPLFRTLAREKRECTGRLAARLHEIEQTTARELYAAAVYLSPLLSTTFGGVVDELLLAHERWIDACVTGEQADYQQTRDRLRPALDLTDELARTETGLLARLEPYAGTLDQ
jgi:hypothetical protein